MLSAVGLALPTAAQGQSSSTMYRVNVGGPTLEGIPEWSASGPRKISPYLSSSLTKTSFTRKWIKMGHPSLPHDVPRSIFRTQRNAASYRSVSFDFPVEPGKYEVRLFFAEIRSWKKAAGKRVMNVSIEGVNVLRNFDVFKIVGRRKGLMRSFTVTSDEVLDIGVTARKGRPMINGIEVINLAGDAHTPRPDPPPAPEAPPTEDPSPPPAPPPIEDDCIGTEVSPGDDLEATVENGVAGEVFCIASGTYEVTTLTMKDDQVLDGAGVVHPGLTQGADRPTVFIRGSNYTVITGGSGVTLKDVDVTDPSVDTTCDSAPTCGEVISPEKQWHVLRSRVHHADAQCIGGAAPGMVIEDTELDHCGNRFNGPDNNGFSAAVKSITGYVVKDSYVHDSNQGVWCDHDCSGDAFVVTNSVVEDNCSFGIHYEYTYLILSTPAAAFITDNIVRGNNWCDLPAKADIGIVSAESATVTNNVLGASPANPEAGYGFTAFDRGLGASTGIASNNKMGGDVIHKCEAPFVCK